MHPRDVYVSLDNCIRGTVLCNESLCVCVSVFALADVSLSLCMTVLSINDCCIGVPGLSVRARLCIRACGRGMGVCVCVSLSPS